MLARKSQATIHDYVSDRVFDGARPLAANHVAKLKANYLRDHSTPVHRFVATVTRVFRFSLKKA